MLAGRVADELVDPADFGPGNALKFSCIGDANKNATVCRYLNIDEKELAGPTRRPKIAVVRALVGYIATREMSISGSKVVRRLNADRSAISRA